MFVIPVIVHLLLCISMVVLWAYLYEKQRDARNGIVFTIGISVLDMATDVMSLVEIRRYDMMLFYMSLASIIATLGVNMLLTWYFVWKLLRINPTTEERMYVSYGGVEHRTRGASSGTTDITTKDWLGKHFPTCSAVMMSGSLNIENLLLLSSNILDADRFKIRWPEGYESLIVWSGMLNVVLEDIPQVGIQVYFLMTYDHNTMFVVISVITSCVALVYSITKRLLLKMA